MCLNVYHPDNPISIPYYNEQISFPGENDVISDFRFLIRNNGKESINRLYFLFPGDQYVFDEENRNAVKIDAVYDLTNELPMNAPIAAGPILKNEEGWFEEWDPSEHGGVPGLTLHKPEPNNPVFPVPGLHGEWHKDCKSVPILPEGLSIDSLQLIQTNGVTFFMADIVPGIKPGATRWFYWSVRSKEAGHSYKTPFGCVQVLQVASPFDVHRATKERLECSSDLPPEFGNNYEDEENLKSYLREVQRQAVETLKIDKGWLVDIKLYELTVHVGRPSERFLFSWMVERDLQLRANSPMLNDPDPWYAGGELIIPSEPTGEGSKHLRYDWKGGSRLRPNGYPWQGQGFNLTLMFSLKEQPTSLYN